MKKSAFIDWQGASVLPHVLLLHVPPIFQYSPRLFDKDGQPIFSPSRIDPIPFPPELDSLPSDEQESIRWEHRIASCQVAFLKGILRWDLWEELFMHPLPINLNLLLQSVLRACADGPTDLAILLTRISDEWDSNICGGPCPYTFSEEERCSLDERIEKYMTFESHFSILKGKLMYG